VWNTIATWSSTDGDPGDPLTIDETDNPIGKAFATTMVNAGATSSSSPDALHVVATSARHTCVDLDHKKAEAWLDDAPGGFDAFQLTTPNESAPSARCGKVFFSDVHAEVATSSGSFPSFCSSAAMTPQELALAFALFEMQACVRDTGP
jgi:hypothetical protein